MAAQVLDAAKRGGATAAETEVSQAFGLSVTVRKDDVETIAYNRDKGIGVTVYVGTRRGHASTADFSPEAIADTVTKALTIARYTAEDDCAGLADPALLAHNWGNLDLYHPWDLSVEDAIALGRECESAALAVDPRLTNSDGATVSLHEATFVYANTNGFSGGYPSSRHGLYCSVIADDGDAMQRDDDEHSRPVAILMTARHESAGISAPSHGPGLYRHGPGRPDVLSIAISATMQRFLTNLIPRYSLWMHFE